jgi:hypothetical protein
MLKAPESEGRTRKQKLKEEHAPFPPPHFIIVFVLFILINFCGTKV